MADPLTALMYAVQVMNFLKTLILKTLRERKESAVETSSTSRLEPSDENGHQSPSQTCLEDSTRENEERDQNHNLIDGEASSLLTSDKINPDKDSCCETPVQVDPSSINKTEAGEINCAIGGGQGNSGKGKAGQPSNSNCKKGPTKKCGQQPVVPATAPVEKTRGISNLSRIDSISERIEAWR
jgi:hypothetical protein